MSNTDLMDEPTKSSQNTLGEELAVLAGLRRSRRDALLLRLSIVAMLAGVGVAVAAYFVSHLTADPLVQRDAIVLALAANAFTIAASAAFVVSAMSRFLRFWLARLIYAQATDGRRNGDD